MPKTERPSERRRHAVHIGSWIVLIVFAGASAAVSRDSDWHPLGLVFLLAFLNVASELLAIVRVVPGGRPLIITLSAPLVLVMALLGPFPAFVIAAIGLTASALRDRTPLLVFSENTAAFAVVTFSGGLAFRLLSGAWGLTPSDAGFALLFVGLYAVHSEMTFFFATFQDRLNWGEPMLQQYRQEAEWRIADGIGGLLATSTVLAYGAVGTAAVGFLAVVQLAFQYIVRKLARLADLSASRGRLVGQVLAAEETERGRLAESLHDDALQDLVFAQGLAASQNGKSEQLTAAIGRAVEQLRAAIFDLHPAVLKHAGLAAALHEVADQQAQRAGFKAEVKIDADACGPNDQLLFALGREQLTNAAKHANATEVSLSIARQNGSVVMQVADNGCGMDDQRRKAAVQDGHIGLASSIERVEALGGKLEIESTPGQGTRVVTAVPVEAATKDRNAAPSSESPAA
jgi:signal transduction histidine kinase